MIGGFELDGRDVVESAVKPLVVELMWVILSRPKFMRPVRRGV
jgi:hypothetical protein